MDNGVLSDVLRADDVSDIRDVSLPETEQKLFEDCRGCHDRLSYPNRGREWGEDRRLVFPKGSVSGIVQGLKGDPSDRDALQRRHC
jgi:hypothetical protein